MRLDRIVRAAANVLNRSRDSSDEVCEGRACDQLGSSSKLTKLTFDLGFSKLHQPRRENFWNPSNARRDDEQARACRLEDADSERFSERGIEEDLSTKEELCERRKHECRQNWRSCSLRERSRGELHQAARRDHAKDSDTCRAFGRAQRSWGHHRLWVTDSAWKRGLRRGGTYEDANVGVQSADFGKSSDEEIDSFAVDEASDADNRDWESKG